MKVGDTFVVGDKAPLKVGNRLPLKIIPGKNILTGFYNFPILDPSGNSTSQIAINIALNYGFVKMKNEEISISKFIHKLVKEYYDGKSL